MNDEQHYNDGYVDLRCIPEFSFLVYTTVSYETEVLCFDDNFFVPKDMLDLYKSMLEKVYAKYRWKQGEEFDECVNAFKAWLIETGCPEEELIED